MSFLGSLENIVSDVVSGLSGAASDPGKVIGDALEAVLPNDLDGLGELAAAGVDCLTGHEPAALTHATSALADLPELIQDLSGSASPADSGDGEPSPPPSAATARAATAITATAVPAAAVPNVATSAAAATSSDAVSASSASGSSSSSDLKKLLALSPDAFMQAVTSGNLPDDIADSPTAMMQVQAKLNEITEMNQIVTQMMAAQHQMQMSIVQNIRC